MKLGDLGEFEFIDRIKAGCLNREQGVVKGIGDDCAVYRISDNKVGLLTTDMLIEDVHFRRNEIPAGMLGRKSLAVSLSDIAAMSGTPKETLVSLGIPIRIEQKFIFDFYSGLKEIAREFDVNILGGDTVKSPDRLVINVALAGECQSDSVVYRHGAKIGDSVFVTGYPGLSSAGLDLLRNNRNFPKGADLLAGHFNPVPQIGQGQIIGESGLASSMIDISDGLAGDLGHICECSGVGAVIRLADLPLDNDLISYAAGFKLNSEDFLLYGGEDYILLGTTAKHNKSPLSDLMESNGFRIFFIGEITDGNSVLIMDRKGNIEKPSSRGYDHFRKENLN